VRFAGSHRDPGEVVGDVLDVFGSRGLVVAMSIAPSRTSVRVVIRTSQTSGQLLVALDGASFAELHVRAPSEARTRGTIARKRNPTVDDAKRGCVASVRRFSGGVPAPETRPRPTSPLGEITHVGEIPALKTPTDVRARRPPPGAEVVFLRDYGVASRSSSLAEFLRCLRANVHQMGGC